MRHGNSIGRFSSGFTTSFAWGTVVLFNKVLMVAACLLLPILWGVVVNWIFNFWNNRADRTDGDDESIFPDYQI